MVKPSQQQLLHQMRDSVNAGDDLFDCMLALHIVLCRQRYFRLDPDRCQRRVQFMRGIGAKDSLPVDGLGQAEAQFVQ